MSQTFLTIGLEIPIMQDYKKISLFHCFKVSFRNTLVVLHTMNSKLITDVSQPISVIAGIPSTIIQLKIRYNQNVRVCPNIFH